MKYLGGKSKSAAQISNMIRDHTERVFVNLFCGACNVESKITDFDRMILNDAHPYLIAMLKAVQNGYELPDRITEEQYYYIKEHKDDDPVLAGFVGFACSFGGGWFNSYARDKKSSKEFAAVGKRGLLKKLATLQTAEFQCNDYRAVVLPPGAVIYADPPYRGTTGYKGLPKFDSDAFWEYARETSKKHLMFISEMDAPADFIPIWKKQQTRTINNTGNAAKPIAIEKLFVHRTYRDLMKTG